jgi:hypothetical protein
MTANWLCLRLGGQKRLPVIQPSILRGERRRFPSGFSPPPTPQTSSAICEAARKMIPGGWTILSNDQNQELLQTQALGHASVVEKLARRVDDSQELLKLGAARSRNVDQIVRYYLEFVSNEISGGIS